MRFAKLVLLLAVITLLSPAVKAQRTEITVEFTEQFFDALLDAVFQSGGPPEFSIAASEMPVSSVPALAFGPSAPQCSERIKLLRENNGVRTAVRFRNGQILAPLAFTGSYNPPLVGCVGFNGYAETDLQLDFDAAGNKLVARARVNNVSLNGTGGLGGSVIAKLVQSAIDRKINPIEILSLEKLSFAIPIKSGSGLTMKATAVRHEILDGKLIVRIVYDFVK